MGSASGFWEEIPVKRLLLPKMFVFVGWHFLVKKLTKLLNTLRLTVLFSTFHFPLRSFNGEILIPV